MPATQSQEEWWSWTIAAGESGGVHRLKTWGEESSDAFKGFLQEAEYSVALGFGLYRYTHEKRYVLTGDGGSLHYRTWMLVLPAGQREGLNTETGS